MPGREHELPCFPRLWGTEFQEALVLYNTGSQFSWSQDPFIDSVEFLRPLPEILLMWVIATDVLPHWKSKLRNA